MSEYLLKATQISEELGKPICFARMTGIGPMTSADPGEWARFRSDVSARDHPANNHLLASFDVVPADSVSSARSVGDGEKEARNV